MQQIIGAKSLSAYTHIILDEVHERDQHTDFALLLVKKLINTVSGTTKVSQITMILHSFQLEKSRAKSIFCNWVLHSGARYFKPFGYF